MTCLQKNLSTTNTFSENNYRKIYPEECFREIFGNCLSPGNNLFDISVF